MTGRDRRKKLLEAGTPCALVSLLAVEGSAPREAGTRMVVTQDGLIGTIGGGNLEYQAIHQARAVLSHPPGTWRIQDYPLGPLLGQCCGGRVRLMVERLDPVRSQWLGKVNGHEVHLETRLFDGHVERAEGEAGAITARGAAPKVGDSFAETVGESRLPLLMFGAGHVGQAIAKLLPGLPLDLDWRDSREGHEPAAMEQAAREANGLVLILTHDHALDYRLTAAALRGSARFIGLIGSATKRARFLSRLSKDGFDAASLARLTCPIGIAGITGKAPEVIAVSVVAQLLMQSRGPQITQIAQI
ncbi:xanthine dehydrogenase accessory protein XdhC [Asticcacaulis biprosthecium]